MQYSPHLQTETYVRRARHKWGWNKLCKAIAQVNYVRRVNHHHYFTEYRVDENKKSCHWWKPFKGNIMRINHYMSRSRQDFKAKMARGNPLGEKRDWRWFHWADRNDVYDDSMKKYTKQLREVLLGKAHLLRMSRKQVSLL
jgi:hypothetical protein